MNMKGYPELESPSEKIQDSDLTEKFWKLSEDLTNTSFPL
jgi:hypothetical protein